MDDQRFTAAVLQLLVFVALVLPEHVEGFAPSSLIGKKGSRCGVVALWERREATFGMGCFWKPSEELLKVDGVLDTVVGYTGVPNAAQPPTYDSVCFSRNWVEGVRVTYDDTAITYPQLLDAFFEAQEPKVGSRQYASLIFPATDEQEEQAQQWLQDNSQRMRPDGVPAALTQLERPTPFYRAENYHQEYWQKTRPRIAASIALLAVATGILDSVTPVDLQSSVHTAANAMVLAGIAYVGAERVIGGGVEELK